MTIKLKMPHRKVNEKMTLEALHRAAETYREMYDKVVAEKILLKQQLAIAVEALKAVLHDEFILEHADAGLVMYLTQAEYKIKELEK